MDSGWNDTERELAALLQRCARGDHAALRRIYDAQAARLKGVALRITGSEAVAEDVVHDVFLRLWQEAADFDPERGSARAWLTTMTRYRALTIIRRRGREVDGAALPEEIDHAPDALDLVAARVDGEALHACLNELEPPARHLITLAFLEGRSHAELARTLNMPLGTVKSTIRRALAALRKCFE